MTTLTHYTTADGLLGIIQKKVVWATHSRVLNDYAEVKAALASIDAGEVSDDYDWVNPGTADGVLFKWREAIEWFDDLFVASFSERPDDLAMWLAYGTPQSRFAIEFDREALQGAVAEADPLLEAKLLPVRYTPDEFGAALVNVYRELDVQGYSSPTLVAQTVASFKKEAWRFEKESRLVVLVHAHDGSPAERIEFRSGRYGLTPYIEIRLAAEGMSLPTDLIKTVWVGPGWNQSVQVEGLRLLQFKHGLQFNIELSKHSYRD